MSLLVIIGLFVYNRYKENIRYKTASDAIYKNKEVTEVLHTETIGQFTLYFYQPEDKPIVFDYVYQDDLGFKVPTKTYAKEAYTEHQTIWHNQEKNGKNIVVISKCLFDLTPFTITDNINSNYQTVTFMYNEQEFTYYVSIFDYNANDYKLYIDNKLIANWENKKIIKIF